LPSHTNDKQSEPGIKENRKFGQYRKQTQDRRQDKSKPFQPLQVIKTEIENADLLCGNTTEIFPDLYGFVYFRHNFIIRYL